MQAAPKRNTSPKPRSSRAHVLLLAVGTAIAACKAKPEKEAPRGDPSAHASLPPSAASSSTRAAPPPVFPGAEPPNDARSTPSGVRYRVIRQGQSDPALRGVVADVDVWTRDGQLAFSSNETGPSAFPLTLLPDEFRRVLAALGVDSTAVFWLPKAALEPWAPPAIPRADIVLRLTVRSSFVPPPATTHAMSAPASAPAPAPESGAPPADALRTPSGLRYVTLVRGQGAASLAPDAPVSARVDVWAQSGITLTSVVQGIEINTTPARAPGGLGEVMARVLPGSRTRIWVPARSSGAILPDQVGRELILDVELSGRK